MSQLAYSNDQGLALNGQIFDLGEQDVMSYLAEVEVPFGHAVLPGTNPETQAKLPTVSGDIADLIGVAVHTHAIESKRDSDPAAYQIKDAISVLKEGRVWVKVEEAVAVGDDVFVRYAAGGNGLGAFGKTAGTSERAQVTKAKWIKGAAINGLAVLEIDL